MTVDIATADVREWARTYEGPKFHAMLCDPPYELGFMGRAWDRQGVAFDPATWAALAEHLHPGGFGMAFASSRGWHRLACAIEDAGLRIHPSIFGWAQGSGFPKATRVKDAPDFDGHRYGGQALKPALEPIIVFQKPYAGRPVECITATGAGSLWVDGARVPTGETVGASGRWGFRADSGWNANAVLSKTSDAFEHTAGRWPPNFVLQHAPGCRCVGERRVRGSNSMGSRQGARHYDYADRRYLFGTIGEATGYDHVDADGLETVAAWECTPECPVRRLGEQSGERASVGHYTNSMGTRENEYPDAMFGASPGYRERLEKYAGDTGTAARFFPNADWSLDIAERIAAADPVLYAAKVSRRERNAGLDGWPEQHVRRHSGGEFAHNSGSENSSKNGAHSRNHHPTVKPLALARWLATLLLPPDAYAPRRLLVPFSGSGSECIGAMLAGWEDVRGVEGEAEYVEISRARLAWWEANHDKAPEVRAMERAEPVHSRGGRDMRGGRFAAEDAIIRANGHAHAPMLPGLEAAP